MRPLLLAVPYTIEPKRSVAHAEDGYRTRCKRDAIYWRCSVTRAYSISSQAVAAERERTAADLSKVNVQTGIPIVRVARTMSESLRRGAR